MADKSYAFKQNHRLRPLGFTNAVLSGKWVSSLLTQSFWSRLP